MPIAPFCEQRKNLAVSSNKQEPNDCQSSEREELHGPESIDWESRESIQLVGLHAGWGCLWFHIQDVFRHFEQHRFGLWEF